MAWWGRRAAAAVTICGLMVLGAGGCGGSDDPPPAGGKRVVAASVWEAAFAKAAGAKDVKVIVPASVTHIADYDPKPSDLAAMSSADLVLYAEFEGFAGKLKQASGSNAQLVALNLDNSPDNVRAQVRKLAGTLGTGPAAESWIVSYDKVIAESQAELKQAWVGGKPPKVIAQTFVTYAAQLAGAEVLGTYGPGPVTPAQLAGLAAKKPDLVLDNAHMSAGQVLPEATAKQVRIINYPGADADLLTVYRANTGALVKALKG